MECAETAVDTFRRAFGAEALVDVLEEVGDRLVARFYGNMCYTCGAVDYFDDFAGFYSDCTGEEWGVEEYRQNPDGSYTVVFRPRRLIKGKKRHVKIILYGSETDLLVGE